MIDVSVEPGAVYSTAFAKYGRLHFFDPSTSPLDDESNPKFPYPFETKPSNAHYESRFDLGGVIVARLRFLCFHLPKDHTVQDCELEREA